MDNITKTNLDACIDIYAHYTDHFDEKFPRKIIRDNPELARDMLDHIKERYNEALKKLSTCIPNADVSATDYQKTRDIIKDFYDIYRTTHIEGMKELYEHIWNTVSSEIDNDGTIRVKNVLPDDYEDSI